MAVVAVDGRDGGGFKIQTGKDTRGFGYRENSLVTLASQRSSDGIYQEARRGEYIQKRARKAPEPTAWSVRRP